MSDHKLLKRESEIRANHYTANALLAIGVIIIAVWALNVTGVYDGVRRSTMNWCCILTLLLLIIPRAIVKNTERIADPRSKYVIVSVVICMILILASLLNIHVTLMLIFPMLLATQYRSYRVSLLATIGSCICALLAPCLAYILNTWSYRYLAGYLETVCDVKIVQVVESAVPVATTFEKLFLFWILPQLFILIAFSVVLYSITRTGILAMETQEELIRLNTLDSLTGLYTKEFFYRQIGQEIRRYPNSTFYIVVTDVHNFKMVNEIFGHETGDLFLKNIANILREYMEEKGICGRLGNDSMAFLIPKKYYDENILSECLRTASRAGENLDYYADVYAGVYGVEKRELSVAHMCDRAKLACDSIKGEYHKNIAYYNQEMNAKAHEKQTLIHDLMEAIEKDQFEIYLQPQVNGKEKVLGAEVLVRWKHPKRGLIMPGEFIGICEKNGMISSLDSIVWEKTAQLLKRWKEMGREDLYLSINISTVDFYRMNVYSMVTGMIEKYGISPANLHLEITETAVMIDLERQIERIRALQTAGFSVEMDDFGTGYSALGLLKDIQVDSLKLDMAFIQESVNAKKGGVILKSVLSLGKELGICLISEGVETQAQYEKLRELGCDLFQGYLFSKPIPVEEFEKKYMGF